MATAKKTAASSKANPFAKLKDAAAAETNEALHAAADVEETGADEETEDEVAAAKARLAAKRAARAKAAPEPEPEEIEEEDGDADSEEDDEAEVDDDTPAALADDSEPDAEVEDEEPETETEPAPQVKRSPRRTAAQVEREAAEREARLQEQIDALKAQVDGKADASEITVLQDRVVLEDGVGGDVRVVGNGRSLVNDDWRCTVDGLALLLGRSSSQATQQFKLPLSLVPSLAELLSNVDEITE